MSNGGYKGSTPARETSPEQYPGVWELTEQFQAQADGNWPFQETDCAPKSLRFDGSSSPSASLSRTPPAASDRRTWSWSAWIKRGKISSEGCIFTAGASTANTIRFNSNDTLKVNAGSDGSVETVARFRDPSAWLHLLVTLQTGAVTDSDRLKIYVNNVLQTVTGTYPTKDGQGSYNAASVHYVGRQVHNESNLFDGCIADLQFIDGQALTPDAFTFIDGQGVLQPKRFTGDYASGPVYSALVKGILETTYGNSSAAAPFNGSTGSNYTDGIRPNGGEYLSIDFGTQFVGASTVKIYGHASLDGVSYNGANENLKINGTALTSSQWADNGGGTGSGQQSATFTLASGLTSLEWGYSSGSQSTGYLYLQGIEVDGILLIDALVGRNSFHLDFATDLGTVTTTQNANFYSGSTLSLFDGDISTQLIGGYNSSTQDSDLIWNPPTGKYVVGNASGDLQVYAGYFTVVYVNGVSAATGNGNNGVGWVTLTHTGAITSIKIENTATAYVVRANGFKVNGKTINEFFLDKSGVGNDWNTNNLELEDISVDSPVNGNQTDAAGLGGIVQGNYASINPLDSNIGSNLTNGNLDAAGSSNWSAGHARGTFALTSGKWYWEVTKTGGSATAQIGFCNKDFSLTNSYGSLPADSWTFNFGNGTEILRPSGGGASYFSGGAMADGDVAGIALDMDNKTAVFYKNGTAGASIDLAATSTASTSNIDELFPLVGVYNANVSFNGGQGAYKYQNAGTDRPSADYKSLCTTNLPEPSILFPSQYFDTKLWSGNSGDGLAPTQDITTSFAPSFVWIKSRTDVNGHSLFDIVRGIGKRLHTNTTGPETTKTQTLSNFLTNGFRINGDNSVNDVGQNYVSWSWAGGDATTTIAVNSIRAVQNVTAGNDFSAGWAGFNQSFWANTDSWSNLPARNGNAKGYWPNTETLSDGHVFNSPDFGSISSGTGGHVLRASSSCTLKFTVYSHITEIAITTSDSQTFADRTIIATNPTANSIVEATGKCFWFSTTSAVPNIGAIGTVNNAPALPSIASTVRSSPESGFSIVKATAGGSYGMMSIGHGLNQKPSMVFTKRTDNPGGDWLVHTDVTGSILQLELNKTDAGAAGSSYYSVGSNTFSLYHGHFTDNNHELINYCFAPIEGFSSFGSYTNPSGSEGAFVFLGFKPELIIIKCAANISSNNGLGDWIIKDATRSPFNNPSDGNTLVANVNNAEDNYYSSGQVAIDILSNGFKIRHPGSGPAGDTGRVYIYAAWAESPFKTARAN